MTSTASAPSTAAGGARRPCVELVEVSPRDGLQNEPRTLSTEQKPTLIERACAAGARRVEVTSFAHPGRVPQMADAEAVVAGLPARDDVVFSALVLNERGYERAAAAGVRELNTVVLASETFSHRNQGVGTAAAIAAAARMGERAAADGIRLTVTVAAAFGCPFEGELPDARFADVVARVAAPRLRGDHARRHDRRRRPRRGGAAAGDARAAGAGNAGPRLHLHDTRNTGVANAIAGVRAGVRSLDASLAGLGGCPFAPAAAGNVATEDLVYALGRMGFDVGVALEPAIATARWIAAELGGEPASALARAGGFPPADGDG